MLNGNLHRILDALRLPWLEAMVKALDPRKVPKRNSPSAMTRQAPIAYIVEGFNWFVRVEVDQHDTPVAEALEAATCGVAKFMHGEANVVDASKTPRVGFLCGAWKEDGPKCPPNFKLLDSSVVLANGGFFKESMRIREEIEKETAEAQAKAEMEARLAATDIKRT